MFQHILVPLDGSSRAEQALPLAAHIARSTGGKITLLSVLNPVLDLDLHPVPLIKPLSLPPEEATVQTNDYLTYIASSFLKGIYTHTEVLTGTPSRMIVLFAQLQHINMIVMCSHGITGNIRWWLGSVAQHVIRHTRVPTLVLHEGGPSPLTRQQNHTRSVKALVALDGSPEAEAALSPAAHLSTILSAPAPGSLHLLHVLPIYTSKNGSNAESKATTYLAGVKQRLSESNLTPTLMITFSVAAHPDVAETLIRVAEQGSPKKGDDGHTGCDLIALTAHGRDRLSQWFVGSTAERVLSAAKLPLLIVRPE